MNEQISGGATRSIFQRVKAILLRPRQEWPVIAGEPTPSGDLFTGYALPLAAIGPFAAFLGSQLFGYSAGHITYRPSMLGSFGFAIASYVQAVAALFMVSFIANKAAPSFGGEASTRNAFKLIVYSMTAAWVAGIFALIPSFSLFALLGFYSLYLLYTGAGPLMEVPAGRVLPFTLVIVASAIAIFLCLELVIGGVGRLIGGPSWGAVSGGSITNTDGNSIVIPNLGLDPDKIKQAAKEVEEAATSKRELAAPAALEALLPDSIGSYRRTAIKSDRAGPVSNAEGSYEAGDKRFTLKVADMGVIGAVAGMAGTLGAQSNRQDADGYERTSTKDGNLIVEKWDRADTRGTYMTMVGKHFMIEAEGSAASIDELKAAVAAVDADKLAALGEE